MRLCADCSTSQSVLNYGNGYPSIRYSTFDSYPQIIIQNRASAVLFPIWSSSSTPCFKCVSYHFHVIVSNSILHASLSFIFPYHLLCRKGRRCEVCFLPELNAVKLRLNSFRREDSLSHSEYIASRGSLVDEICEVRVIF